MIVLRSTTSVSQSAICWSIIASLSLRFIPGDQLLGIRPQLDDLQRHLGDNRRLLLGHEVRAKAPSPKSWSSL